jgi:hypothetical protein
VSGLFEHAASEKLLGKKKICKIIKLLLESPDKTDSL